MTITLVASSLLVGGFAFLIADKITTILLDSARSDVRQRVTSGASYAAKQVSPLRPAAGGAAPGDHRRHCQLPGRRRPPADQRGGGGDHRRRLSQRRSRRAPRPSANVQPLISPELRAAIADGKVASQIRTGRLTGEGHQIPGLRLAGAHPLRPDRALLPGPADPAGRRPPADARATVVATGVALVILLGLLAALVTRLVVNPVRVAARTAQRLSAGPARPADGGQRRGRPGPAGRRRSTRWPPTCNGRSCGWRRCPGCSAGSPRTSRTSCVPR